MIQILTLEDLSWHGHDVYEFCLDYQLDKPVFWHETSLYLDMDDVVTLEPYFDEVIFDFQYYGAQRMALAEWEKIKELCLKTEPRHEEFFREIDNWLKGLPEGKNSFWILGI